MMPTHVALKLVLHVWLMNCLAVFVGASWAEEPAFCIHVVDDATGLGVPLIELESTSGRTFVTDSAGMVAFNEPGWMDKDVWFHIRGHGYEAAADGFGFQGVQLKAQPGRQAIVKIRRLNIAQRLCRLSGSGIFRDSVLAGKMNPEDGLLMRGRITGYDSVQSAKYRGQMYWFWGDTNQVAYPLGNFHMTGATTPVPDVQAESADPYLFGVIGDSGNSIARRGLPYEYFLNTSGFVRGVCPMPGEGPTWLDGLTVLKDDSGNERMYAAYSKIKPPLTTYRRGICLWNDDSQQFDSVREFSVNAVLAPFGHPQVIADAGRKYVYFGDPFPAVRVPADIESFLNLEKYEGFTPLQQGTCWADRKIDRAQDGRVRYGWKRKTPPLTPAEEREAIREHLLTESAAHWRLTCAASGEFVESHRGTVFWNEYRKTWILIATQLGGTSQLGEVWYAESAAPTGPWRNGVKIISHENYSFYNPFHHRDYDMKGGQWIHIEGTYTHAFSGNPHRTPDYDYNQILYRLDLADSRLRPAGNED